MSFQVSKVFQTILVVSFIASIILGAFVLLNVEVIKAQGECVTDDPCVHSPGYINTSGICSYTFNNAVPCGTGGTCLSGVCVGDTGDPGDPDDPGGSTECFPGDNPCFREPCERLADDSCQCDYLGEGASCGSGGTCQSGFCEGEGGSVSSECESDSDCSSGNCRRPPGTPITSDYKECLCLGSGVLCSDSSDCCEGICDKSGPYGGSCSSGGGGTTPTKSCLTHCRGLGFESGRCLELNISGGYCERSHSKVMFSPYNRCSLDIEAATGQIIPCNQYSNTNASCYCYNFEDEPCSPNCTQRCASAGCQELPSETKVTFKVVSEQGTGLANVSVEIWLNGTNQKKATCLTGANGACPVVALESDKEYLPIAEVDDYTCPLSPECSRVFTPTGDTWSITLQPTSQLVRGCDECGEDLTNYCPVEECLDPDLGNCFFKGRFTNDWVYCFDKDKALHFIVRDGVDGTSLPAGVMIRVRKSTYGGFRWSEVGFCSTDSNSECYMIAGIEKFEAYIDRTSVPEGYTCLAYEDCNIIFTPDTYPYQIVFTPKKIVDCSDTDAGASFADGKNYFQQGTARDTDRLLTDSCLDANRLQEHYCQDNVVKIEEYSCSGGCQNGACVAQLGGEVTATFNVFYGNNVNWSVYGVKVQTDGGTDTCITDNNGKCSILFGLDVGNSFRAWINDSRFYSCQEEFGCPVDFNVFGEGQTINLGLRKNETQGNICRDSDGEDIYTKGVVMYVANTGGALGVRIDSCRRDDVILNEAYCREDVIEYDTEDEIEYRTVEVGRYQQIECQYGCQDGACLEEEPEECPPFICDLQCDEGFEMDENGCLLCQCKEPSGIPTTEVTFKVIDEQDVAMVGVSVAVWLNGTNQEAGTCSTDSSGSCSVTVESGEEYLPMATAADYTCPLSSECSRVFTPTGDTYDITLQLTSTTQPPPAEKCEDSDAFAPAFSEGKNYYSKGTVTDAQGVHNDTCASAATLNEFYCENNIAKTIPHDCYYGCDSGVCKIRVKFRVTDKASGSAIAGATVAAKPIGLGLEVSCETGEAGQCFVELGNGFQYQAVTTPTGYNTFSKQFTVATLLNNNMPADLVITLELDEVLPSCNCITVYNPVCGANGETYSSTCHAKCAKVAVDYQGECQVTPPIVECEDSDGGKNFGTAGFLKWYLSDREEYRIQNDVCRNEPNGTNFPAGPYLIEMFCLAGTPSSVPYECPNGCQNGACQPLPPPPPAQGNVTPEQGGTIEIQGGIAAFEAPPAAVKEPVDIIIEPVLKATVSDKVAALRTGEILVGKYVYRYSVEVGGTRYSSYQFEKKVKISISFTESQIQGLDRSSLRIAYYDRGWGDLPTTLQGNTAIAWVDHFTDYTLITNTSGTPNIIIKPGEEVTGLGEERELCCNVTPGYSAYTTIDSDMGCESDLTCDCNPSPKCLLKMDDGARVQEAGRPGVCVKPGQTVICPFGPSSIEDIIDAITKWVFYLAMIIAPLMIVIGAFMVLTSGGDPARVTKARRLIIWAAIGLAIILFSRAIYGVIKDVIGFQ